MTTTDLPRMPEQARLLWQNDAASRALGIELIEVGAGYAHVALATMEAMANGLGTLHGGVIFTLADTAFGLACNSHDTPATGLQCDITYLRPGRPGDRLTAAARERARVGRSGLYDVTVTAADGTVIAEFRGHSRALPPRQPPTESVR